MPTTSTHALRYPSSNAAPNVNQDIQNLATDVDTLLARFVVAGAVSTKRLRLQIGSGSWEFSAAAFVNLSINFASAGFTVAPYVAFISDENGGNSVPLSYATGNRTTTTAVTTARTAGGTAITASVPFIWIAIGH